MNLFITGTDTDAGKTTVAAWICWHLRTAYWKPIQTGTTSDAAYVKSLAPHTEILPEVYRLKAPLSPYDAAKKEGCSLQPQTLQTHRDQIVIEGAGGLFVPIADEFCMKDMIRPCRAKALVVARSKLGMINHLSLTIYALKKNAIPCVGIVICGDLEPALKHTIETFSATPILQVLPESENLPQMFKQVPLPTAILEVLQ